MNRTIAAQLLSVLDQERQAILAGDTETLAGFDAQKATLAEKLKTGPKNSGELAAISAALNRNARLLSAAITGVKAARSRLAALAAVRDGLSTYSATGNREIVATRKSAIEHKA